MLERLNPLNWFSEEEMPDTTGNSSSPKKYKYELNDKSRIEDPIHPSDAARYRYTGVYQMSMPLYGYKATSEGIARLIIPRGATVVVPSSPEILERKKLRTGEVYVDKIICARGRDRIKEVDYDLSIRNWYEYQVGKQQIPKGGDLAKTVSRECAAGLHFFITPQRAIDYYNRYGDGVRIDKNEAAGEITPDG